MSKKKIMWIIILSIIVLGLFLAVTGFMCGADLYLNVNQDGVNISNGEKTIPEIHDLEKFENIEISLGSRRVSFIESDSYRIEVFNASKNDTIEWYIDGNTLKIEDKETMGFDFRFLVGFFNVDKYINIYYPKNAMFDNINVSVSSGKIQTDGLNTKNVTLKTTSGRIEINDCKYDNAEIRSTGGRIDIDNMNSDIMNLKVVSGGIYIDTLNLNQLTATTTSGRIELNNIKSKGLIASTTSGRIDVRGELLGENSITSTSGSIHTELKGNGSDYNREFKSTSGHIEYNGEKFEGKILSENKTDNSIYIKTTSGSIKVNID